MSEEARSLFELPPDQQAIRARCFHPNGTLVGFKKEEIERSIHARFEQVVLKYPDRIAVRTSSRSFTYHELNAAANRIAHSILKARGKGNEPVTLLVQHEASEIAASLGVLKTGKILVPINPSLPHARIIAMLEDLETGLVLTDSTHGSLARELCRDGLELINVDALGSSLPDKNIGVYTSPDAVAYVLYTSGSTGQPKGAIHNHRNVLHFAMEYANALHISTNDRMSLLYPISVMGGAQDMFSALLNGASLFPFDVKQEGFSRLASWLRQQDITVYHSVPTVFRSLLDVLGGELQFPSLRLIKLIGEPVSNKDVQLFKKHFRSDCVLVNVLSSTETGAVAYYFVDQNTVFKGAVLPVGYPVEDKKVVLLDDAGHKVGFNQIGEITIKSRYLSLGYWRRPDLTRRVFSPDLEIKERRVYRTGNVGRLLSDGCLEHLGRKDLQIKIRGHRIEMEEIEVKLLDHPSVKAAAVTAHEGSTGQCLVAHWVPAGGLLPAVKELRSFLQDRLPDYMVPSFFVKLDALPLLANGKVDRQALPAANCMLAEENRVFVPPRTPTEAMIAEIWAELFKLDAVGVHDNFFDLGGHSLLATQIISKVLQALQVELSVRSFFEVPTVAGLAERIETIHWARQGDQAPVSRKEKREQGEL